MHVCKQGCCTYGHTYTNKIHTHTRMSTGSSMYTSCRRQRRLCRNSMHGKHFSFSIPSIPKTQDARSSRTFSAPWGRSSMRSAPDDLRRRRTNTRCTPVLLMCLRSCVFVCLSVYLSSHLFVYPSTCRST